MNANNCTILKSVVCLLLLATALTGCTSRIVKPGDQVGIQFTCRLPNGEVAAGTRPEDDAALTIAPVYVKRNRSDALVVVAGGVKRSMPAPKTKSFEDEIVERLAGAVVGLAQGSTAKMELVADRIEGLSPKDQFVKIARIRKRPKEMRLTVEEYKGRTGQEPAIGQSFILDPLVPGKVSEVSGDLVLIRFSAQVGKEVDLPFGKGVIREKDDRYEIEINAVKGVLVRTGAIVGRIMEVDDEFIALDYGHPFGGETLSCDVMVESVAAAEK